MSLLLEATLFGLTVAFMFVGLLGIVVPILPGTLLIWLSVVLYAFIDGFDALGWPSLLLLSLITLVTGTADIWLTNYGARQTGASRRSLFYGTIGSLLGFLLLGIIFPIIGNIFGGIIGYMAGVIFGEYRIQGNWNLALRASLGGLAGWGAATAVQLGGGIIMMLIFIWQVLSFQG